MTSHFQRKLNALDYPQPDHFDTKNDTQWKNLVLWLEDQKIRHFKIEDRGALRNIANPQWTSTFTQYLAELNCPYTGCDVEVIVDWLLGYAVRLEYGDDVDQFKTVIKASAECTASHQSAPSTNPLDTLNFEDADFKAGVASLAMLMQIPPHLDHLQQLKAISVLVNNTLTKEVLLSTKEKDLTSVKSLDEHIPLEKTELGFDAGDYILSDAAKVVRLLHMKQLRDLQTKINAAIVAVQAVTADPKTDSRLGKVGR